MPKLQPEGTKTAQLELAKLADFFGLSRLDLVGVSAQIALITGGATKDSFGYDGTQPHSLSNTPRVQYRVMKQLILLFALSLLAANTATASPHKVHVTASKETEKSGVPSSLKARINATERYQTIDNAYEADLIVSVICMTLEKYRVTGAICSYTFIYKPPSNHELRIVIGEPGQVSAPDAGQLAEMIFQDFVNGTTEDSIMAEKLSFARAVFTFCSDSANQAACGRR